MTQQKKNTPVAPKAPKKLIPRTAPKIDVVTPLVETVPELAAPPLVPAPTPATASAAKVAPAAKNVKKPAATPAKAKPAVAPAEKPVAEIKQPLGKPVKAKKEPKAEKPVKAKKVKLVRDSYAMPEAEYAQINVLKKRLSALKQEVKKSELLRAGIAVLTALNDEELAAVMSHIERIKTGRPVK
mgnify:CR=1 FL=1